jgi:hypothetical protein
MHPLPLGIPTETLAGAKSEAIQSAMQPTFHLKYQDATTAHEATTFEIRMIQLGVEGILRIY